MREWQTIACRDRRTSLVWNDSQGSHQRICACRVGGCYISALCGAVFKHLVPARFPPSSTNLLDLVSITSFYEASHLTMPIVGSTVTEIGTTTLGSTTYISTLPDLVVTYNASEYSHSTVYVTFAPIDASFTNLNAPPLTTHYTQPSECEERWMLAGGQEVTTTRRIPTAQASVTAVNSAASTNGNSIAMTLSAPLSIVAPSPVSISPIITSSAALLPRQEFVAQNFTVMSLDLNGTATDPSYRGCQPYRLAPTYSPGICPHGQTIAEVTAWQVNASTGYRTFWQASCCKRSVISVNIGALLTRSQWNDIWT